MNGNISLLIDELIERSSLGTPAARALRRRTSEKDLDVVRRLLARLQKSEALSLIHISQALDKRREGAAGVDLGQLAWVTDQDQLGARARGCLDEGGQGPGADHARLVEHHHMTGSEGERPGVDLGQEPGQGVGRDP